ncbi:MAG: hypothetical protein ACREH6_00735 [Geminicoccaceae bacterium]
MTAEMTLLSAPSGRDQAVPDARGTQAPGAPPALSGVAGAEADPRDSLLTLGNSAGVVCMLALDHRDAMRNIFRRAGIDDPTEATTTRTKARIIDVLAGSASSILLDAAAAATAGPRDIGLVMPLEAQGHEGLAGGRLTHLMEDFGPAQAAEAGADACKLLLYYREDHAPTAIRQRELLAQVVVACHASGLPLVLEPLVYRLEDEDEPGYLAAFPDLVAEAAGELAGSGADLLKLQFPGDAASCARLSEVAAPLHWTLLGGSHVESEAFIAELEIACRSGACGFIAGRAVWGGAIAVSQAEQGEWLRRHALPVFDRLVDVATAHGRRIQ